MSVELLRVDNIHQIMLNLSTRDVLRCMQVNKYWKTVLSDQYFWKKFIQHRFDLTLKPGTEELDGPLYQWSDPQHWFCYFDDKDPYVVRPFPSLLKCDVVVPHGLDLLSANVRNLQGVSRSLEILVHMKKGINAFHLGCGYQCSGNEGCNDICVVLFPWEEDGLPDSTTVLSKIFHFHPEVSSPVSEDTDYKGKLFYHLVEDDHELDEKPCLNMVFGRSEHWKYEIEQRSKSWWRSLLRHLGFGPSKANDIRAEEEMRAAEAEFFSWLQNIMVPTKRIITGDGKLNPVVDFFITKLAPGWVGGALTGQCWT